MVAVNVFLNDQLLELEPLLVKEPRFELVHYWSSTSSERQNRTRWQWQK